MQRPAEHGVADLAGALGLDHAQGKRGQRRRGHQAEVPGAFAPPAPATRRTPGPRRTPRTASSGTRRRASRYAQSAVITVVISRTRLNAATTPSERNERQRQHIQERGVVVLREIDALREGEDLLGGQRVGARGGLVLEHPLVPDVHAGIAAGIPGQTGSKVQRQGPREGDRHHHVTQRDAEAGAPFAPVHHADRRLTFITIAVEVGLESRVHPCARTTGE